MTRDPTSAPEEGAWRSLLARRLASLALVAGALGTLLTVLLQSGRGRFAIGAVGLTATLAFALASRLGTRHLVRSWLVVGAFLVAGVGGYATVGFLSGPAGAILLAIVLGGLLLGARAMAVLLALTFVAVAAIAWGMVTGLLPAPPAGDVDPRNPLSWVRSVGMALLFAGVAGTVVSWVVAQVESSLETLQGEVARRLTAEEARRHAEHLATESQKLELVGRMTAGLAHDFNNHLAVISMANGQLAKPHLSGEQRRDASLAVSEAVRRAGALARQLLVLGRSAPRHLQNLALRRVVDALLPSLRRVLPSDIELTVEHGSDARVRADETQIHQALLNFVVNARDAMRQGGHVVVRTRAEVVEAPFRSARGTVGPGTWSVIEVEDDGVGIDDATLKRAFDPFFTTKPLDQGSGLGLSTVAMIADSSGGHVVLSSEVGRGTCIALWLPAVSGAPDSGPKAAPVPRSVLAGGTILLIEDEPLLLEAVRSVLVGAGCRVLTGRDGTEALAALEAHRGPIDLLCTDVVMPGATAREVIERFHTSHPGSPVLTCSGYVGEELVRRGIEEGRYALLEKPFTPEQLLESVSTLVAAAIRSRSAGEL